MKTDQLALIELPTSPHLLPTNLTTQKHPIHRWFNFIAGYSPEFVTNCIQKAALSSNDVVIEPFAGLSTTLVQANLLGIPSIGFEPHPFFFDISLAKINPPRRWRDVDFVDCLNETKQSPFEGELESIWAPSALTFLRKLIPEISLRYLANALSLETRVKPSQRSFFRLIISRVLESVAGSQTDGIYKAPTSLKRSIPYHLALDRVMNEIKEDLEILNDYVRIATLRNSSSERMARLENQSCNLCVTSPPYLNNFDFAEMTRMELYFWRYAENWGQITDKVRARLIVNTTTAPTKLKRDQNRFTSSLNPMFLNKIHPLIAALREEQKTRAGKKDYHSLVAPYFSQMHAVIKELRRVLRAHSSAHFVVGDAALYGVHIKTHEMIAELMEYEGFEIENIIRLRTRGERWILAKRDGSKTPLGEFEIHARRR